jgi:hypothetical protein
MATKKGTGLLWSGPTRRESKKTEFIDTLVEAARMFLHPMAKAMGVCQ